MARDLAIFLALAAVLRAGCVRSQLRVASRAGASRADPEAYTFDRFVHDYGRTYVAGSKEFQERAAIFERSLLEVRARRATNVREGRSWSVGVNPFMDWTREERKGVHGYKPRRGSRGTAKAPVVALQMGSETGARLNLTDADGFGGSSVAMRNQGNCGSCWAISAVEAVEAQLHKNGGDPSVKLSAQALVDCVPNPQHCGGKGGCDGATGELAYTYIRDHGIPLEGDLPYQGRTGTCPSAATDGLFPTEQRVRLTGWHNLPSNKAKPLMEALVQEGPAVVAVDANDWFDYSGGVYDGCARDATLVHAVLLKAYGNADDGKKYWLIQNSWGAGWGENGDIRLLLRDDEDEYCGMDSKPEEGLGCDGGPPQVRVCGQCGLLFDPVIPQGASIEGSSAGQSTPAVVADLAAPASAEADDSAAFTPAMFKAAVPTAAESSSSSDPESIDLFAPPVPAAPVQTDAGSATAEASVGGGSASGSTADVSISDQMRALLSKSMV